MRIETFTNLSSNIQKITTTNTAQYLSTITGAIHIPCRTFSLIASATNVSAIGVGPASTVEISSGYPLEPSESITLDIDNLNKIKVVGTADDLISWVALDD